MLRRVRLKNICQHEDLDVSLGSGLTVVIGPQGSGKSNLLTMALSTLSGENLLYGSKKSNVRRLSNPTEPSYVFASWQGDDGTVVDVTRGYRKKRSELQVKGEDKELRREADITREIETALGINAKSVIQLSYVPQGQTDALIMERPVNRTKFIAELLELSWLIELEGKFKDSLSQLKGNLEEDYLDQLKNQIIIRNANGANYEKELSRRNRLKIELSDKEKELEKYSDLIAKSKELDNLRVDMQSYLNKWESTYNQFKQLADSQNRLKIEINGLPFELDHRFQLQWRRADVAKRKGLDSQLAALQQRWGQVRSQLVPPSAPSDEKPDDTLPGRLEARLIELDRRYKLVLENKANCTKCGAPTKILPGEKEEIEEKRRSLSEQIKICQSAKSNWDRYYSELHNYKINKEFNESSLRTIEEKIEETQRGIENLPQVVGLLQGDDQLIAQIPSIQDRLSAAKSELTEVQKNIAVCNASISHYHERYNELKKSIDQVQYSKDDLQKADRVHSEILELRKEYEASVSKSSIYWSEWSSSKSRVKDLVAKVRKHRTQLQARTLLEEVAKKVNVKDLPRKVLRQFMGKIASRMSDLCYELGQPFSVSVGDELEFLVAYSDGGIEQAQRLSGGQKACLSTVFWLTRLTLGLGKGLPLLVLDEPTANMDEQSVSRFGDMLMRLGPILKERNQQVIVVTHHSQLRSCGNYVIDLGDAIGGKVRSHSTFRQLGGCLY